MRTIPTPPRKEKGRMEGRRGEENKVKGRKIKMYNKNGGRRVDEREKKEMRRFSDYRTIIIFAPCQSINTIITLLQWAEVHFWLLPSQFTGNVAIASVKSTAPILINFCSILWPNILHELHTGATFATMPFWFTYKKYQLFTVVTRRVNSNFKHNWILKKW